MSQPKLSQSVLYEVLVSEIESLKKTKKEYNRVYSQISDHLQRLEALYNQPICVDTGAMREEHENIKATLHRGLYIPNWLGISWLCLVLGFSVSVVFNYKQYVANKHQRVYIQHAKAYIDELEEELNAKSKKRR